MRNTFDPGFTVMETGYEQGSSGGQIITVPVNPGDTYCDSSFTYIYFEEGPEGKGWYYFDGDGNLTFKGESIDTSGMSTNCP